MARMLLQLLSRRVIFRLPGLVADGLTESCGPGTIIRAVMIDASIGILILSHH